MSSPSVIRQYREKALVDASELFELGPLEDATSDESFLLRLNTVVVREWINAEKNPPVDLSDAISVAGTLDRCAALVAFGRWLLLDGHPGMERRGGRQANPRRILKCIAAIMAEIRPSPRWSKQPFAPRGRKSRKQEITKHILARQWKRLFGEEAAPSDFDAPLRSARRILPLYLKHLKSGAANHAGKQIKTSPKIKGVLKAISGMSSNSKKDRPEILTDPDAPSPARLVPFEIPLEYQSAAHADEHRRLPSGTRLEPRLRYVPTTTAATLPSGKMRADRDGTITLVPEVAIRRDYRVRALIDRIAILLSTTVKIDDSRLKAQIERQTGTSTFVRDLTKNRSEQAWGTPLPVPDLGKRTGYHFAIMIQEPTPDVLAAILKAIQNGPGIAEPVLLHLIEVSVDFYAKQSGAPEEVVLRRERMVGLLQRHHWARPSRILEPSSAMPRYADARQLSEKEIAHGEVVPNVGYLFSHESSSGNRYRMETDGMISDPEIRKRILTTKPGYALLLNATVAKGGKHTPHLVTIQHKIADRRNSGKKTHTSLPDDERRARMEVTISGTETLKQLGLETIDDLGRISFGKLTREFLRCKLPIIQPQQHLFADAQIQMRNRGVYGINLRLRALALERRQAAKQAGGGTPRQTKDEEMGLGDWKEMNDVIGDALDGLKARWNGFTTA